MLSVHLVLISIPFLQSILLPYFTLKCLFFEYYCTLLCLGVESYNVLFKSCSQFVYAIPIPKPVPRNMGQVLPGEKKKKKVL